MNLLLVMLVNLDLEVSSRQGSGCQAIEYGRLSGDVWRTSETVGLPQAAFSSYGVEFPEGHSLKQEKKKTAGCVGKKKVSTTYPT